MAWGPPGLAGFDTGEDLGDGRANTAAIISHVGEGSDFAAERCASLTVGDHTDWYLPSRAELKLLYSQRVHIGGFADAYYWSSTVADDGVAYAHDFSGRTEKGRSVETELRVCAVRRVADDDVSGGVAPVQAAPIQTVWEFSVSDEALVITENHPSADGEFRGSISGTKVSVSGYGSSGGHPSWPGVPSIYSQSGGLPLYMLGYLPHILLRNVDVADSGSFRSEYFVPYQVNYAGRRVDTVVLPYEAGGGIHGEPQQVYSVDLMSVPGLLYRVDFSVTSDNPFISGSAMMLLSTGYPNGMLYLCYEHDTGYTTLAYQQSGGGSSGGLFTDGYTAEYDWIMFAAGETGWNVHTYTVSFGGNGADGGAPPTAITGDYPVAVTLPGAGTLTRTGHTFVGWNTASDGSGTSYAAGASYTTPAGDVTLYGQWMEMYTLTYDANGADGGDPPAAGEYASGATVTLPGAGTLTRTGYAFAGWNTATDGSGTAYAAGASYTMPATNVTLYAVWIADIVSPNVGTLKALPGGTFNANGTDVTISAFRISRYEITHAQYEAVMGSNPAYFTGDRSHPVETVSWYDAIVFCNTLSTVEGKTPVYTIGGSTNPADWGAVPTSGNDATWDAVTMDTGADGYRLPTEAEWEYAAKGGAPGDAYTYAGSDTADDVAWYSDNSGSTTHPVGQKLPNKLGLYDMSGNVWEWTWDWWGTFPRGTTDPAGAASGAYRVVRGGGWGDDASICSVAYRYDNYPYARLISIGFRVVRP